MERNSNYYESINKFKRFVTLRNKVTITLSIVVLICYYVFVAGIGLFPDVLGYRLGPSSITLGIMVGIFLIILCILTTGLYTFFANKYFDKVQQEVIEDLEKSGALDDLKLGKTKERENYE